MIFHCPPGKGEEMRALFAHWFAEGGVAVHTCRALDSAMLGVEKFTRLGGSTGDWKYAWDRDITDPADLVVEEEVLEVLPAAVPREDLRDRAAQAAAQAELEKHVASAEPVTLYLPGGIFSAIRFRRPDEHDRGDEYEVVGKKPKLPLIRFEPQGPDYYVSGWTKDNSRFWLSPWSVGLIDNHEPRRRKRQLARVE